MKNILQPNSNGREGIFKAAAFALLFAAVSLLVLPGCRNPVDPQNAVESRTGTLSLAIGGRGAERTIMPETILDDFVAFYLNFVAGSYGNTDFSERWTGSAGAIELDVGIWDLHVTAYLAGGAYGEYLEAARGSLCGPYAIEILPGQTVSGSVRLYPIAEGEGRFSWDISLPGNVVTARMEIMRVYCDGESYSRTFYFVGGEYFIELSGDEDITPEQAILPGSVWNDNRNDITITLRGAGPEPSNVRLSANGSLFRVGPGVTLVLDENIILVGRSVDGNGRENNHSSLVFVYYNMGHGIFVMNEGARITGNSNSGVGIHGGIFIMHGGEVTGNTGGGVRFSSSAWGVGGTFIMHGGEVSGNTGLGIEVLGDTFTMYRQSPSFLDLCLNNTVHPELRQAVSDYFLLFSQGHP